jgi:hypothetical protein
LRQSLVVVAVTVSAFVAVKVCFDGLYDLAEDVCGHSLFYSTKHQPVSTRLRIVRLDHLNFGVFLTQYCVQF